MFIPYEDETRRAAYWMVMDAATMAANFHSPVKAGQGATVHTQG